MRAFLFVVASLMALSFHTSASANDSRVVKAVNKIRLSHGLTQLQLHPSLQTAAKVQSKIMARKGRMSHNAAWGYSFKSRLKRGGYRVLAAENIARGQTSLNHVLDSWMKSRGHRRNMLNPRMKFFGLAVVKGKGRNYWAMVLGG